jgi:hypothetical protein
MMAVDERSRRELYERLEATLGSKPADTAMALLPPAGWSDFATKKDLELLEQKVINTLTWRLLLLAAAVIGTILPFVV